MIDLLGVLKNAMKCGLFLEMAYALALREPVAVQLALCNYTAIPNAK